MLTQVYFKQDTLDLESIENEFQYYEEQELEFFERSVSEEFILNDPVWRLWRLICRNFENCTNDRCPYSHPLKISLDFIPEKCSKEHRFHDGICRKYHRISSSLTRPFIVAYGVSVYNSNFIRWKKNLLE